MNTPELLELVLTWIVVAVAVILLRARRKTAGAGLTVAYLLNLSLIHLTGATIYLFPGFQDQDARLTTVGFLESTIGVVAFAVGSLFIAPLIMKRRAQREEQEIVDEISPALPRAYMLCGLGLYALSLTSLGTLPSIAAIVSTGQQLVVAALVLFCWQAWRQQRLWKLAGWVLLSLIMPATTVLTSGMLGYGMVSVLTILTFVLGLMKSPAKMLIGGAVLTYLGLSFFVSYMRDRAEIRESVWGEQSYGDRLDHVTDTFSRFEWFDPQDRQQLQRIDDRLNQNFLVGAAVNRLSDVNEYANGETFWQAVLALIPRAMWPDKPIEAGSGNLVTRFTGIEFAEGTSVGIGQAMEFYANFGTYGVVFGFLIMGVIITVVDGIAASHLRVSNFPRFVFWYLPGLSLLQVGGQLVEITASALGCLIVAFLLNKYLRKLQTVQPPLLLDPVADAA